MNEEKKRAVGALCEMYEFLSARAAIADNAGTILFQTSALTAEAGACGDVCSLLGEDAWKTALESYASGVTAFLSAVIRGKRRKLRVIPYRGVIVMEISGESEMSEDWHRSEKALKYVEHETRGAIATMLAALDSVESGLSGADERMLKNTAIVKHNLMKLMRVTSCINGVPSVKMKAEDAAESARKICGAVSRIYEALGLSLDVDIPADPVLAVLDRKQFERMLLALFTCSAKFAGSARTVAFCLSGGEKIRLTLTDPYSWFAGEYSLSGNSGIASELGMAGADIEFAVSTAAEIASAHGGALVIDDSKGGVAVTVSFPKGTAPDRVSAMIPEINAGLDSVLVEMSGVLGSEFYVRKPKDTGGGIN